MESKLLLSFILFFSSWVFMGFSQGVPGGSMPCIQKLLPCKPYLHSPSPPPSCCVPMKEMVTDESKCLCEIFNNAEILKGLNVTKDDALNLSKACGAKADISVCKSAMSPTSSPGTPASPNASSPSNSTGNSDTKSSAYGISHVSGFGFITLFLSLIIAAL